MGSFQEKISAAILTRIRKRRPSIVVDQERNRPSVPTAKLREVNFSDFEAVAQLKKRCGIVEDSPENWTRLWRLNPALAEEEAKRPIGWVLDTGVGIVGYLGNISLQCRYGDKTLSAVATHGFCADPPYRAVALSLASAFYRQTSVDFFVSSSAIEVTGKMALAFKCAAVPQADYDTVLFWVLRPYSFSRILARKLDIKPLLSPISSAVIALGVAADKLICRRWPRSTAPALKVTAGDLDEIGDEIAQLWNDKLKEGIRLYADRSPEVLRWHFEIPGDRGCVRLLCCTQNNSLKGYAIVRSDADPCDGIRRSIIADLIAKQDDPAVVQALWVAAYKWAKVVGSDILEVQGFPSNIRDLSSDWRPYRRKYPACPYYYKAADPLLQKELSDPAAWYACPYDGDATLIRPSYSASGSSFLQTPIAVARERRPVIAELARLPDSDV
jgi:hypothetical protein